MPTVPPAPTTADATTVPVPTAPPPSPSMAVPTTSEPDDAPATDELPDGAFAEGAPSVPAAADGEVAVVLDAPIAASGVAFVVRNGTDEPVHDVEVSAVVRDAEGRLVAAGAATVVPGEIVAGGWAVGAVRFGHDALTGDAEVELAVTRTTSGPSSDRVPLAVTDATLIADGEAAELTATVEGDVDAAARASVACFDGDELTGVFSDEILADAPAADAPIPVSIEVPADVACPAWIVVAEA